MKRFFLFFIMSITFVCLSGIFVWADSENENKGIYSLELRCPMASGVYMIKEGDNTEMVNAINRNYIAGTVLEITVVPIPSINLVFDKWTGSVESSDSTIIVVMDSDKVITSHHKERYKLGDLNRDGVIDSTDYILLRRYILKTIDDSDIHFINHVADLNGDGEINSTDAVLLRRYILGQINTFKH
ncbi:dockerin type I repeat-containing protein [Herbivorax sp. ANBcel31]|uniref:dockerin type I repeat-containing protein n=1 Tax=Herbivorax sp. ANBcel31 TaxID=3069754 RepID=UPI0027AF1B44|nr:dockerin type I repeat-containing protein [Herbivorax sp. ANBcel31]MDQ2085531.1 dockerin type I repeat-containing protein [Herbivorax sp. ANBcel31]